MLELKVFLSGLGEQGFSVEWHEVLESAETGAIATAVYPQIFVNGKLWRQGNYPDIFELGCSECRNNGCCENG